MRRGLGRHNYRSSGASSPVQQAIAALKALNPVELHLPGDFISSLGSISQWNDSSGNSHHLVQGTGSNQLTTTGDGAASSDGLSQFMATTGYTLVQPETVYMRFKPASTNSSGKRFADGMAANSGGWIFAAPGFNGNAGVSSATNTNLVSDTYNTALIQFNSASSLTKVGATADQVSDMGTANMGGLTIGAAGGGIAQGKASYALVVIFPTAQDATTRGLVIGYINTICAGIT